MTEKHRTNTTGPLPSPEFWRYSLKLYSKMAVKNICLELQQLYDINVNMVLLCCWYAFAGHGVIPEDDLLKIKEEIEPWHEKITKPLRELRSLISNFSQESPMHDMRKDILADELIAEHIEHLIILNHLGIYPIRKRSNQQKISDCIDNFHRYFHLLGATLDRDSYDLLNKLVAEVFRFKSDAHRNFQSRLSI